MVNLALNKLLVPIRRKENWLAGCLLAICSFGYPIAGIISAFMNWPSQYTSIPFRMGVATFASVLLLQNWRNRSESIWQYIFFVFLAFYTLRLAHNVFAGFAGSEKELLLFLSTSVLPSFALLKINIERVEPLVHTTLISLTAVIVIAIMSGEYLGWFGVNGLTFTGRMHLTTVNPITLGHTAAALILMIVAWWLSHHRKFTLGHWFLLIIGLGILSYTSSRGVFLALLIPLVIIMLTSPIKQTSSAKRCALPASIFAITIILFWFPLPMDKLIKSSSLQYFANDTSDISKEKLNIFLKNHLDRIDEHLQDRRELTDESITTRLAMFKSSFLVFINNPIWGGSNWIANTGHYPHNLPLEAFQNLGIVGGGILIVLLLKCCYVAWFRLKEDKYVISLLFFQALILGQFSGSLYGNAQLWTTMAILLTTDGNFSIKRVDTS